MKKLEKLTLKELADSVMVSSLEDQKSIVAGSGEGGYWFWSQETGWTYMLDEVTVTGSYVNRSWYGNFLGPGPNGNPDPSSLGLTPINQLDSAAYNHDVFYYYCNATGVSGALFDLDVALADAQLSRDAFDAAINGDNDLKQQLIAGGTSALFGVIASVKMKLLGFY